VRSRRIFVDMGEYTRSLYTTILQKLTIPRGFNPGSRHGYYGRQETWLYVTMHDYSTISLADDDPNSKTYLIGHN